MSTTLAGNITDLTGTAVVNNTFVRFELQGTGGNQARVGGTALIAPAQGGNWFQDFVPNSSGVISGTIYSTRDATGLLDGEIEVGGSTTAVWYAMTAYRNGKPGPRIPVHAKNGATLDISNVTPITTNPVVTAPTGDSTYARIDGGNTPFTGPIQVGKIDGMFFVDGSSYAQTAAGLNAAVTAANAAGGGHVIVPASLTVQAQIVLKSNVYVHLVNGAIITAGSALPSGTTVVSANTITDAGFWGVIDGASLTNVADGFDLVSCSRFHGSVDVRNTGKRAGVDWGVYINACTDCYIDLIRVRNHGEGTIGTNGVYITGTNSNVVIDTMDVDGTTCQAGNGNINVDGSGVHVKHVIATNPTGPVGNLKSGDGIIITATDSTFDLIETSNNSAGAKGASNVTIQGAAARLNFGTIVSDSSTGNGIEINSGATNTIQDIRIGTAIVRNAGLGGAVSNQAAFEVIGNAQISKNITVGSLHAIDSTAANTKYAVLLQQSAGGTIDEVSIGRVHAIGMTTANVSTSGTITNFSYSLPEKHYTSAATGVVLRQNSTAASGRDWAIGSNFIFGAGEWGIYDYTTPAERFVIQSDGTILIKKTLASYNGVATIGNGIPVEYAQASLTAQGAAISATTLYAVPAAGAGIYRVNYVASITRAGSVSSTLGGANGFQVLYTDPNDSVVKTTPAGPNSAANTTATCLTGSIVVNAKASTNIQYTFGYTDGGGTTMQFDLAVRVEAL